MLTAEILERTVFESHLEPKLAQEPATNFEPVARELDVPDLTVRGELPATLRGTLYRNGPSPQFPSPQAHFFTGDGMVHAITLADGRAAYRNRWVRTPKWLAENRAGRALYAGFAGLTPDAPAWAGDDSGSANTNIVWHAGKLLALEEAHPPTQLEPGSLDTHGYVALSPLCRPFTAHPKVDPATGEMVFFGYSAAGPFTPDIAIGILDARGALTQHDRLTAPYPSMIHDFAVTEGHIVIPVLPLAGSLKRAHAGGPAYAWEPRKGAFLAVLSRADGTQQVRWYQGEPCFAFHVTNAWEEGPDLIMEVLVYDEPPLFPRADGAASDPNRQRARPTHWIVDLRAASGRFRQQPADDLTGEFPRIDERRAGRAHRHSWLAANRASNVDGGLGGLVHYDRLTDRRDIYWLPPGDTVSEGVFAPRGEAEGDGWLLAVACRANQGRSELLVFEACALSTGPIATVEMPQRIPFGFHGAWVEAMQ